MSPRTKNRILPAGLPRDNEAISITDQQSQNKKSNLFDIDENGLSVRINPQLMNFNDKSNESKRGKKASIVSDRFSQIMSSYNNGRVKSHADIGPEQLGTGAIENSSYEQY